MIMFSGPVQCDLCNWKKAHSFRPVVSLAAHKSKKHPKPKVQLMMSLRVNAKSGYHNQLVNVMNLTDRPMMIGVFDIKEVKK